MYRRSVKPCKTRIDDVGPLLLKYVSKSSLVGIARPADCIGHLKTVRDPPLGSAAEYAMHVKRRTLSEWHPVMLRMQVEICLKCGLPMLRSDASWPIPCRHREPGGEWRQLRILSKLFVTLLYSSPGNP